MPGVFVKAGNQGDKWHTAGVSVSLGSAPGFWVRFRAIRGINTNSDVAIEELRLTLGTSPAGVSACPAATTGIGPTAATVVPLMSSQLLNYDRRPNSALAGKVLASPSTANVVDVEACAAACTGAGAGCKSFVCNTDGVKCKCSLYGVDRATAAKDAFKEPVYGSDLYEKRAVRVAGTSVVDVRILDSDELAFSSASTYPTRRRDKLALVDVYRNGKTVSQQVALRFDGVAVPRGAKLTGAYIEFTANQVSKGEAKMTIQASGSDSAPAFNDHAYDKDTSFLSPLSAAADSIAWTPSDWLLVGGKYRTPDLSSILQPVVSRMGWSPLNALALVIKGSGRRVASTFRTTSDKYGRNFGASTAALIHLEFHAVDSTRCWVDASLLNVGGNGGLRSTTDFGVLAVVDDVADAGVCQDLCGKRAGCSQGIYVASQHSAAAADAAAAPAKRCFLRHTSAKVSLPKGTTTPGCCTGGPPRCDVPMADQVSVRVCV